jgi:hypothetical protein
MENQVNTQVEQTEEEPKQLDISNLSDEEFEKNFDNLPEERTAEKDFGSFGSDQIISEEDNSIQQEIVEEVAVENSSVNETQTETETTPEEDIFASLPEEYRKVFQPIKANGVEIQPDPEKMIQLIQLGSKYYADREKIKPQLNLVKTLEKSGLTDEDRLNLLIDVNNGDTKAIMTLLKEKGIDPYDLDEEGLDEYKPKDYSVPEEDSKLDDIVSKIEQTPTFDNLLENVSSYDEQSKEEIKKNPEVLEVLNEHMANGIYDVVDAKIKEDKIFGKNLGKTYLQSYKEHLDELIANGSMVKDQNQNTQTQDNPNAANEYMQQVQQAMQQNTVQQPVTQVNTQTNAPSGAIAPTSTRMASPQMPQASIGEMSDEEYLKFIGL